MRQVRRGVHVTAYGVDGLQLDRVRARCLVGQCGTDAEAGIQRGDVIREINRHKIRSTGDYEKITREAKDGDRLTVLLQRGPMSLYVAFTVGRG